MKRMAKLQPELVAIKEKFKDDPKKQQMATMQLFKDRKVNPVSGCLPQLLTIPFFMGFFSMLSSTAELRVRPPLQVTLWCKRCRLIPQMMHSANVENCSRLV
jgi:YidC/Oxa1 family membrane protein insertase